jgi:hypothetical protein
MATKKYIEFIREWGTDANKPQIKVSDRMIDEIDLKEENDRFDIEGQLEVMFDRVDISESVDNRSEADPYGEEDWNANLPEKDFSNWKGNLWDWLIQLGDDYYKDLLHKLDGADEREGTFYISEIIDGLESDENISLTGDEIRKIRKMAEDELTEYLVKDEDEETVPDPDEYYDRKRLEELEELEK